MIGFKMSISDFRADFHTSDNRLMRRTQFLLMVLLLTLTLTSASIQQYLGENLRNLLGSDLVVSRYHGLSRDQVGELRHLSEKMSQTRMTDITLTHGEHWQKVQLKLIDDAYPIQGKVTVGRGLSSPHRDVSHGPAEGEVWVDARLLTKLGLNVDQPLTIGARKLMVTAVIFHEPDRLMEGHSVAYRAMVHEKSFAGQSVTGSKNHFRYLLEASPQQQDKIAAWAQSHVPDAQLINRDQGHHPLAAFWQRVENFIGLASVLLFFMAAIALDLASRRQVERQKFKLALYMSMGMSLRQGLGSALGHWLLNFLTALGPAVLVAYGLQGLFVGQFADQFAGLRFGGHVSDLMRTILLVMILLLSFQVPGFLQLAKTSVVSLVRQQQTSRFLAGRILWNFIGLTLLTALYSDNILLTGLTFGAMVSSIALMMLVTFGMLIVGETVSRRLSGLLPFTFFMMRQRLVSKSTQILGVGLCATLLLFTLMLMKDIGGMLEQQIRKEDGNLLITEAQPHHIPAIEDWQKATGSKMRQLRPYTRAQLISVNGRTVTDFAGKPSDSLASLKTPVRMSWSVDVPRNNRVSLGKWWSDSDQNLQQISVEREIMTDVGLSLGDRLTFFVGERNHDFEVVAGHDFEGGAGSITFWFQVPPAAIAEIKPDTFYMGSMELQADAWPKLVDLWQRFPTLAMLPLKEITERYDRTLAMVQKLIMGFSSMILLMAIMVIIASVKGFESEDRKKNGLLQSFGLRKSDCLKLNLYEWLITAFIAGIGAIGGTSVAGILIYQSQFNLTYHPDAFWSVTTLLVIGGVVCAVGWYSCRASLKTSVVDLLSE